MYYCKRNFFHLALVFFFRIVKITRHKRLGRNMAQRSMSKYLRWLTCTHRSLNLFGKQQRHYAILSVSKTIEAFNGNSTKIFIVREKYEKRIRGKLHTKNEYELYLCTGLGISMSFLQSIEMCNVNKIDLSIRFEKIPNWIIQTPKLEYRCSFRVRLLCADSDNWK